MVGVTGAARGHRWGPPSHRGPVGEVPDVAGDRPAAALVGDARTGHAAAHAVDVARTAAFARRARRRSGRRVAEAVDRVGRCVVPHVAGCPAATSASAAAPARRSMPNGRWPAASRWRGREARPIRPSVSHGASTGSWPGSGRSAGEHRSGVRCGARARCATPRSGRARPTRLHHAVPSRRTHPGRSAVGPWSTATAGARRCGTPREVVTVRSSRPPAGRAAGRHGAAARTRADRRSLGPRRSLAVTTWPSAVERAARPTGPAAASPGTMPPGGRRAPAPGRRSGNAKRAAAVGDDHVVDRFDPASRARSTSSTVRARSSGRSASKPRSPRSAPCASRRPASRHLDAGRLDAGVSTISADRGPRGRRRAPGSPRCPPRRRPSSDSSVHVLVVGQALVIAQATSPACAKCCTPGTPDEREPTTSKDPSSHASRTCW